MTTTNDTWLKFDHDEVVAWAEEVTMAWALEDLRVCDMPEFREWAQATARPDTKTDNGWIPGWTIDDCARKWISHNGFPYPQLPFELPGWVTNVEVEWDHLEGVEVRLETGIQIDGDVASLSVLLKIADGIAMLHDPYVIANGFEEQFMVICDEIPRAVAILQAVQGALGREAS